MRHKGIGGSVMVEFDVDKEGRVIRAEAISYSDREFAEPAVRAVRKWRFEPGRRDNKAVPFRMAIPIEFGIENG
jgi:protein TonB